MVHSRKGNKPKTKVSANCPPRHKNVNDIEHFDLVQHIAEVGACSMDVSNFLSFTCM